MKNPLKIRITPAKIRPAKLKVRTASVIRWLSKEHGAELLSPLAVRALWNITGASVRKAIRAGNVEVPLEVWLTDRPVSLIRFESACAFWGEPDEEMVAEMRGNDFDLFQAVGWKILHPIPLISIRDLEEVARGELSATERV